MKVLVTGGTGAFGRAVSTWLARSGLDVVAMARRAPAYTPPGVRFVAGDVTDEASVHEAVRGCGAVVHLAWHVGQTLAPEATQRAVNVGGTANVLRAMDRAGARRIVFASSVTAYGARHDHPAPYREDEPLRPDTRFHYGAHKAEAEALIATSGVEAVVARVAAVFGRGVRNDVTNQFAGPVLPVVREAATRVQGVHQDDVGRFVAVATVGPRTGTVNLAADDWLAIDEVARLLGRRSVRVSAKTLARAASALTRLGLSHEDPALVDALAYLPVADTTRLRDEWGFRCAWTTAEAVADQARSARRYVVLADRVVERPTRLQWSDNDIPSDVPPLDGHQLADPAPTGGRGELDSLIDPRFPVYTTTNISEAFPGPMTPCSLTASLPVMRGASQGVVRFLRLTGQTGHENTVRGLASFGHRFYINLSVARRMAESMPGMSAADIDRLYLGIEPDDDSSAQSLSASELLAGVRLLRHMGPKLAGLERELREAEREAHAGALDDEQLQQLADERLVSRVMLLHDLMTQAWTVNCIVNMVVGGVTGALEKLVGREVAASVHAGRSELSSGGPLRGVDELAGAIRTNASWRPLVGRSVDEAGLARIRDEHPGLVALLDDLVARYGHRGPGELELANPTFADKPHLLMDAAAKAAARPPRPAPPEAPVPWPARGLARRTARAIRDRERARDAVTRLAHALRLAIRERGRRLAHTGVLAHADDVFYLTYDEVLVPPEGCAATVRRRREERARLSALEMPVVFDGSWAAVAAGTDDPLRPGDVLRGMGVSPGVVRAPVRVLRRADDVIEPGEVLVTHVTDTGWTPLFAVAAAVVTDVGGFASHAAVVAREFGVPCVVALDGATRRLADGTVVELDGSSGEVRVAALPAPPG